MRVNTRASWSLGGCLPAQVAGGGLLRRLHLTTAPVLTVVITPCLLSL